VHKYSSLVHYAPPRTMLQQAQRCARGVLQQTAALQLHV